MTESDQKPASLFLSEQFSHLRASHVAWIGLAAGGCASLTGTESLFQRQTRSNQWQSPGMATPMRVTRCVAPDTRVQHYRQASGVARLPGQESFAATGHFPSLIQGSLGADTPDRS